MASFPQGASVGAGSLCVQLGAPSQAQPVQGAGGALPLHLEKLAVSVPQSLAQLTRGIYGPWVTSQGAVPSSRACASAGSLSRVEGPEALPVPVVASTHLRPRPGAPGLLAALRFPGGPGAFSLPPLAASSGLSSVVSRACSG